MRKQAVYELATRFIQVLSEQLEPENLVAIDWLNSMEEDPNICHSHDFIDSNMTMVAAFHEECGRELDPANSDDAALWTDAWELAIKIGFATDVTCTRCSNDGRGFRE